MMHQGQIQESYEAGGIDLDALTFEELCFQFGDNDTLLLHGVELLQAEYNSDPNHLVQSAF